MPRKPTGRPRGRPPGTGLLGEQIRLTVRIPASLYDLCSAFIISLRRARDSRLHRQGCMSYTALDISPLSRDNMERGNED